MISAINKGLGTGLRSESDIPKKKLKEACEDFEAVLINSVFKSMRQSIVRAEEPDQARQLYESMLDETVAKDISRQQGCGLANVLYRQLLPLLEKESAESAEPADDLK